MKYVALAMFFLFLVGTVSASLTSWTVDVSVNEDGTTDWTIMQEYNETIRRSDYFILSEISQLDVIADGRPIICNAQIGVGASIVCNDVNASKITYIVRTREMTSTFRDFTIFNYRFAVTQLTDRFSVTVRLPLGTAIAEKGRLPPQLQPFEPSFGRQGSDGRRIFVEWSLNNPKLGETMNVSIVFERISEERQFIVFAIIASGLVIAALAGFFYFFRRKPADILPVLTQNERRVMEIVMQDKEVDQRKIVKETDYSKAKVSRLIQELEKRGLVEKERRGRKNLVRLKTKKISVK